MISSHWRGLGYNVPIHTKIQLIMDQHFHLNHYHQLVADTQRQFFSVGLTLSHEFITRDVVRLHLPYADTRLSVDVLFDADHPEKGHEISLCALGLCSQKILISIMKTVMHDITKSPLFEGVLALYNAAREQQMLLAEQILSSKVGGALFISRLPGIEYLNAEDQSWLHIKVPLFSVSANHGPPNMAGGVRRTLSYRCRFDEDHVVKTPNIYLSTVHQRSSMPLELPTWNNVSCTVDIYTEQIAQLVHEQWKHRHDFYQSLEQHFHFPIDRSTTTQTFSSFLIEFAPSKKKTRLCYVTVQTLKPFPEHAPAVNIRQLWPEGENTEMDLVLPHSPRWSPEETAQRLHERVVEVLVRGF